MTGNTSTDGKPLELALKKQIDAICDRFELDWESAERPRIEDQLAQLPPQGRRLLLAELLASELALRSQQGETFARAEYAQRFPQDRDVVSAVFDRRERPTECYQPPAAIAFGELIQAFRDRHRTRSTGAAAQDADLPALVAGLNRCAEQELAGTSTPAETRLWLAVFGECQRRGTWDIDAVVRELIASFPQSRRAILLSVLMGRNTAETAQAAKLTERTVESTLEAAADALARLHGTSAN